jgi:hypothetical protein
LSTTSPGNGSVQYKLCPAPMARRWFHRYCRL